MQVDAPRRPTPPPSSPTFSDPNPHIAAHSASLPDFPRSDWSSAVWAPPDLYCDIVTDYLFQWAGKAASIAVRRALDGELQWAEVGTHGIHLAIVDVVLQLRDELRNEHCRVLVSSAGRVRFPTYIQWRVEYRGLIARVVRVARDTLPPLALAGVDFRETFRICTSAVLAGFDNPHDSFEYPPPDEVHTVSASYLRQYDPISHQLDLYGMTVIQGSVGGGIESDEDALLDAAIEWDRNYPAAQTNPLMFPPPPRGARPSATPLPLPEGYQYVHVPSRRMTPPPPPPRRFIRGANGQLFVMYD